MEKIYIVQATRICSDIPKDIAAFSTPDKAHDYIKANMEQLSREYFKESIHLVEFKVNP